MKKYFHKFLIAGFVLIASIISFFGFLNENNLKQHSNDSVDKAESRTKTTSNEIISEKDSDNEWYEVIYIYDGDTFSVKIKGTLEKVRFLGINTPEVKSDYCEEECFGEETSEYLKNILSGQKIRLESDSSQKDRDKYNRLLRYVFLIDGTMLNEKLIKEGFAREYTYQDSIYRYQKEFLEAEQFAKDKNIGLWEKCKI